MDRAPVPAPTAAAPPSAAIAHGIHFGDHKTGKSTG